jgi:sugar transferase (PEP-CTERM/EpsH1 system associated)
MQILIITDGSPYPLATAEAVRIHNLVRRIAARHQVWLAALVYSHEEAAGVLSMKQYCAGVETAIYRERHPAAHLPNLLRYALAGKPLELLFHQSDEFVRKINHLASTVNFDVVQIEHSHNAVYLEALPGEAACRRILVFRNVEFDQYAHILSVERRPVRKIRDLLYSRMMRRWEPLYAGRFDRCVALSNADRNLLLAANPRLQVDVVPNGTDTHALRPLPECGPPPTLLFVGTMSYRANVDAGIYFCGEILPRIRQRLGKVEVWIVGKDPAPEVWQLAGDGVHVTGQVADLTPFYRRSTVCVVPLRAGSGTRLKILETMALGRPVVSTALGCEGLEVVDGEHLLIANGPAEFADKTVQLLTDKVLREQIAANARQLVVSRYDWDKIAGRLIEIYSELAACREPERDYAGQEPGRTRASEKGAPSEARG